ncbi:MAG: zf-HC2 domain-containing protein, partial [Elusimicrobiota bacterium]
MEHPKDSLSPYLDGALSEEERGRVDEHLRACADCAAHLEGLRSVSKLVSSLPKKPLPTGFLQRLNRRAAAPQESPFTLWLPAGPARMAAFAATGILVSLIAYREVRFQR